MEEAMSIVLRIFLSYSHLKQLIEILNTQGHMNYAVQRIGLEYRPRPLFPARSAPFEDQELH
jgi:hypothetical protein